jgi:magnesium chelatase family protein
MPLAQAWSVALVGLEGHLVEVEADIANGLPKTTLIGLPDTSLSEARDRVRAAVVNSGEKFPDRKVTIGLSPATLPKTGSHYDVAIACALLGAAGVIPAEHLRRVAMIGELGLDGRVREVRGTLAMTLAAARSGFARAVVPELNVGEARLVPGIEVYGVRSLRQILAILRGAEVPEEDAPRAEPRLTSESLARRIPEVDLSEVIGQAEGRLAIEAAAAGGHHVYLYGPPGAGKTMLVERLPALMPDLDTADSLEVSAVHSLAGLLAGEAELVTRPPFIAPHHTASLSSLVGGGSGMPRPGAISCAHRGVLFIDEAPEMNPLTLDTLRQPLESGLIEVHRSAAIAKFPARFLLVLAANPCACGLADTPGANCTCSPQSVNRYRQRISGPIKDRIDIQRRILPAPRGDLDKALESTAVVAGRVRAARERQAFRYRDTAWRLNSEIPGPVLRRDYPLDADSRSTLEDYYSAGRLTARGFDRVVRLAWTLADLEGVDQPTEALTNRAYQLRSGEPLTDPSDSRNIRSVA